MIRRRAVLAGGIAAVIVALGLFAAWHLRSRPASDCDTVRDLLAYNRDFTEQTKTSAKNNDPGLSTTEQYRQWAARMKDYAAQIQDPALSARAGSAAELASRTADLVPKYRRNPADTAISREYAQIGIEYANAITAMDYACRIDG